MVDGILDFVIFMFGTSMENKIKRSGLNKVKKTISYVLLSIAMFLILLLVAWFLINNQWKKQQTIFKWFAAFCFYFEINLKVIL